jgi:hypothetical protein
MKLEGLEVKESIKCDYCNYTAFLHHMSQCFRRDSKRSVWYMCSMGHRSVIEVSDGKSKFNIPKEKKSKKNIKESNDKKESE